jgi:protein involved in ribonucleotide reduction
MNKHYAVTASVLAKQLYMQTFTDLEFSGTVEDTKAEMIALAEKFQNMHDEMLDSS